MVFLEMMLKSKILGNNLRETLDTFNFPEGLFKINLGGRYVSSSYEF